MIKRFLVALSFPGEHRAYVCQVADILAKNLGQDKVFYDQWYTAELAQPNMDVLLQSFYHDHSQLIVPFLCADYERKEWCGLEWRVIRDLIKMRQSKDIMPMRFDSTKIPGLLSIDGYVDLKDHEPKGAAELILQRLKLNQGAISKPASKIYSDHLPTVKGEFFGREAELKLLDDAWAGNGTHIIQFIAQGGTGKTKLLRHWLDDHTKDIDALIAWSFYSQGSSEDKQISTSPFFRHAFTQLGSTRTEFASDEEKGEHLAELLRQHRYVLVLDGLEPLQQVGKGMRGELKDRAIRQLLRSLAGKSNGLCIITTRIGVHELSDRKHVMQHNLQNLAINDGIELLRSIGVKGSDNELEQAVSEYNCHALALHLLGNALHTYLEGDARKRDTLPELIGDYDDLERHAFKVMQAYETWLTGAPELKLLYLLGLFDHPIEQDVLQVLWQAQTPELTANIDERTWKVAIRDLREKYRLLSVHENRFDLLDCHPLIREYFGRQLRDKYPETWRQAHTLLYEYYKALPQKELPDTLEEMQPLFHAVAHGCAADLHQQVINEVYFPRIKREKVNFLAKKLGAYSDELAALANFFTKPWSKVVLGLPKKLQIGVLNWASFRLNALGRVHEALEPQLIALDLADQNEEWNAAGGCAGSLRDMQLTLGNLKEAIVNSQISLMYLNRVKNLFLLADAYQGYANVLQHTGDSSLALECFIKAEQCQKKNQAQQPMLYSRPGFNYCEFLLAQNRVSEVIRRGKYALKISLAAQKNDKPFIDLPGMGLLDVALDRLTLGRAYLQQGNYSEASRWLKQAINDLRNAGSLDDIPYGLLTRAALYRDTSNPNHDFSRSHQDLQEVYDIAEPSGMRLHLTDYHLEMTRLLLAKRECLGQSTIQTPDAELSAIQEHVEKAARLIEETGYKRRLPELQELQVKLGALRTQ